MASEMSHKKMKQFLQAFDFASELAEKEAIHLREIKEILQRFLEVKDSLETFLGEQQPQTESLSQEGVTILNQVKLLDRQFTLALERSGVVSIDCIGQEADPELHKVVGLTQHPEVAPETIVQEKVKGYYYRDSLLRRPEVIVAKIQENT